MPCAVSCGSFVVLREGRLSFSSLSQNSWRLVSIKDSPREPNLGTSLLSSSVPLRFGSENGSKHRQ